MLTVIDTKTCNILSVCNAFRRIGAELEVASDAKDVAAADAIVLPGVGAMAPALEALRERGLDRALQLGARNGVPILGICLGMQMLADISAEYGQHDCLGLIPGRVERLVADGADCRVPNIGWYQCAAHPCGDGGNILFPPDSASIGGDSFYFVHSYHFVCADEKDIAASIDFGGRRIAAAVARDNLFGVQFHPEKSQDHGLALLHRFLSHVQTAAAAKVA
jgi:glutamine amidotransferase